MKHIVITGGAGFIGVNTAAFYLEKKEKVTILDNFSRKGTDLNAEWLKKTYPAVEIITADVRKEADLQPIQQADIVFHFAGQVAVTGSVIDPVNDFQSNAWGTVNVLEAARKSTKPPIVIYSSTNKVYGGLEHLKIAETETRYMCPDRPDGIDETEPLDFHSPYGCSKGAADQYVRDYARMYDIPTLVFRQSCIYGPHQLGIEDQGWVAWFLIAAINKRPITIYGTGKQVRDILWVEDLITAYDTAISQINLTKGKIYNMGGGATNSISIWKEFGPMIEELVGSSIPTTLQKERPGDQPYFVANTAKIEQEIHWKPAMNYKDGISHLYRWLKNAA